jgi:ATP-dependent DNA ligase
LIEPMLGKLVRELPVGDYIYEPKWDGFRCIATRVHDDVDLRSRNKKPLQRYFPEVVESLLALDCERFVMDGELIACDEDAFDFSALMLRLHPAKSRVDELARATPACFVAFDLLSVDDQDLMDVPFAERRRRLEAIDGLRVTPATDDPDEARKWLDAPSPAVDGVMAKARAGRYQPGVRSMLKVKQARTLDVVVAGMRLFDNPIRVASLLLGLHDENGTLEHIGVVANLGKKRGVEVLNELTEDIVPIAGHPWEHGFLIGGGALGRLRGSAARWTPDMPQDWVPLSATRVAEVAYDRADNGRLRYPARLVRWRPDRDARSCTFDQFG